MHSGWGCEFRLPGAAGVWGRRWLEKNDLRFVLSRGAMLDPVRNDKEFPCIQLDCPVPELDPHSAAPDEEQLIFVFMMMPRKDALEFHHFHFLTVQLSDDLWAPVLGEGRKFLLEVHLFHPSEFSTAFLGVFVLQSAFTLR